MLKFCLEFLWNLTSYQSCNGITSEKAAKNMVEGFFRLNDNTNMKTLNTVLQNMIDNIEAIFEDEIAYENDIILTTAIKVGCIQDYSEDFCVYTLYGIVKGLKDMHDKFLMHRDIQPNNIYFDSYGNVKISGIS